MNKTETLSETVARAAPPVAVSTFSFLGFSLQEWVYVLTILYTGIQILRMLPKAVRCFRCFCRNLTCTGECQEKGGASGET